MTDLIDRTQWLTDRRAGIGASDVAAILGLSPWASPYSVWADKVGITPLDGDPTEAMEFGLYAEAAIGPWYTARTGRRITGHQEVCIHPNGWARCTIDGRDDEADAIVEIKTTSDSAAEWEARIPVHYQCQAQWSMHVTGAHRVIFAVLHLAFGRVQFRTYDLPRSSDDIALLVDVCGRFWHHHVIGLVPPDVDGHPATTRVLNDVAADPAFSVDLDPTAAAAVDQLRALKAEAKRIDAEITTAENVVKAALDTATTGFVGGRQAVTWKAQDRTTIDAAALRDAHPDIAAQFERTTTNRVLRLPPPKKDT